jgi:hypothetical protein
MDKETFQTELVKALEHTAKAVFGISPEVIDLEIGSFDKPMQVTDRNVAGSYYGITVKIDPDKIADAMELQVRLEQALIFSLLQPIETAMGAHRKLYGRVDSVEAGIVREKQNIVHRIQRMLKRDRGLRVDVSLENSLGDDVVNFERVTAAALIAPAPEPEPEVTPEPVPEPTPEPVPVTLPEPVSLLEENGAVIPASEDSENAKANVEPTLEPETVSAKPKRKK